MQGPTVGVVATAPAPEPVYVAPPMVEVEPGVQVIEDYDQPVFYSDNMYWRYDGGIWYSSRYHDRGWYRNDRVPERVHHIDHVENYRHYRSGGGVRVEGRHEEPRHEEGVRVEGRHEEPRHEEPRHTEGVRHEEAPRHEEHSPARTAPPPAKKEPPAKHETVKHDEKKHK